MDTIGPPIKNENPQCSPYQHPTRRNDGLRNGSCTTVLGDDSLGGSSSSLDTIKAPTNHTNHEYPSSTTLQSNGGRYNESFKTSASSDSSIDILSYSYIAEVCLPVRFNCTQRAQKMHHEGTFAEDTISITHDNLPPVDDVVRSKSKCIDICPNSMSMARTKELLTVPPQGALKGLNGSFAATTLRDPLETDHMITERKEDRLGREIGLHLTPIPSSGKQLDDLVDFGHDFKSAVYSIVQAYPKYIGFIAQTFYLLIRW